MKRNKSGLHPPVPATIKNPDGGAIAKVDHCGPQRRSAHIHWPEGIVPEHADLFAHNDIVIAAPAGKIWEHLLRPTAWPDWYSNASDVTVNAPSGLLGAGVTFDWITFGAHIHSTVHEFEPPQPASAGTAKQTNGWPTTPGCSSRATRQPPTSPWKRQAPASTPKNSPTPIPATCTAVTTCGTSASSFSAKAPGTSTPAKCWASPLLGFPRHLSSCI